MDKTNILILYYHQLIADGIKELLEQKNNYVIRGILDANDDIVPYCINNDIDIVILDMDDPDLDGIRLIHTLTRKTGDISVLAISDNQNITFIRNIFQAGALGFLLKSSGMEQLEFALEKVGNHEHYICDEAAYELIRDENNNREQGNQPQNLPLTERELEVLKLICEELTNREIAEHLQISVRTVDAHRRHLLEKTDAKNTVGLVKYAVKKGLLDIC
ncbi:MAG: response regulator transcription factor [Balneolaceae bacterium]|nr:response regulator transcription factor [Balneolaceae bacterium]